MSLEPDVRDVFGKASFAHLSTLMADGSPHNSPLWADVVDDHVVWFTANLQSLKARNVARDPRVGISAVDRDDPYRNVWIRGRVERTIEGDEAQAIIDAMSRKYTGADFPMRGGTVFVIEPTKQGATKLPFDDTPA